MQVFLSHFAKSAKVMSSNFLQLAPNMVQKIAESFERTETSMYEDVSTIKTWMQQQPHLPEVLDEKSILNFLFLNKCSIEKTKQKIDMYYSLKEQIPDQFENANPKSPIIQRCIDALYWVPLPKLTKEMYRVLVFKVRKANLMPDLNPIDVQKLGLIMHEVRLHEDWCFGDVQIYDLDQVPVDYILKITPVVLKKLFLFNQKIYSMRVKALYLLNAPAAMNLLLSVSKTLLKPKIFERIKIIKSEELHNYISKEILPKDFGGEGATLEELQSVTNAKYREYQKRFDLLETLKVDESLRPESCMNDEDLGFHGNFKKLDVD